MQRLGQHFLRDKHTLKKIADALGAPQETSIIEVGPGHGELTRAISQTIVKDGNKIIAIEKDHALAAALRDNPLPNTEIIEGDALKELASLIEGLGEYRIAGNIPYYITGKLLRVISELPRKPERAVLLMQREVAERICAEPPEMNRLAASVQFWSDPKIIAAVPKEEFSPPPKVDSAVILLKTKVKMPDIDPERYYSAVRTLFSQPRKTILNNISGKSRKKSDISPVLERLKLSPEARPQNLATSDIISIAESLF